LPFISFFYIIALAKTSSTTLNKISDRGHLCFLPDLKENDFSFPPFSILLIVGLPNIAFIILGYNLSKLISLGLLS
jgi:hypothetical protein